MIEKHWVMIIPKWQIWCFSAWVSDSITHYAAITVNLAITEKVLLQSNSWNKKHYFLIVSALHEHFESH